MNFLATTHELSGSNVNITDQNTNENNVKNNNNINEANHVSINNNINSNNSNNNSTEQENNLIGDGTDLQQQLSNVLGALEDRSKFTIPETEIYNDECKDDLEKGSLTLDSHDVSAYMFSFISQGGLSF